MKREGKCKMGGGNVNIKREERFRNGEGKLRKEGKYKMGGKI